MLRRGAALIAALAAQRLAVISTRRGLSSIARGRGGCLLRHCGPVVSAALHHDAPNAQRIATAIPPRAGIDLLLCHFQGAELGAMRDWLVAVRFIGVLPAGRWLTDRHAYMLEATLAWAMVRRVSLSIRRFSRPCPPRSCSAPTPPYCSCASYAGMSGPKAHLRRPGYMCWARSSLTCTDVQRQQ